VLVVSAPFFAIAIDVSSWYFTKLYHPFALVVMAGGGLMGLCFAFMWVVSMWQMWFMKTPPAVTQRGSQ
jgi:hypothetical protein